MVGVLVGLDYLRCISINYDVCLVIISRDGISANFDKIYTDQQNTHSITLITYLLSQCVLTVILHAPGINLYHSGLFQIDISTEVGILWKSRCTL